MRVSESAYTETNRARVKAQCDIIVVYVMVMAILLAVVPYFVFRWIVEQVARWWFARRKSSSTA